jgi:hypothetical protein
MTKPLLFWLPRVLAIAFAAFLSLFAFGALADAEGHGVGAAAVHFITQLLPCALVLAALAVAWRRQRSGAAIFLGFAVAYVTLAWGRFPVSTYLIIAGPMVITAGLFLADWRYGARR